MKKLLAVILITFLSTIFAFSQTETPKAADWQTFAPDGEVFSIEVPVALPVRDYAKDKSGLRYSNELNGTYFFIFSEAPKNPYQFDMAADFVRSFRQTGTIEKVGEFETEKFVVAEDEDFFHTVLTVKTKNRVYVFQTTSPLKNNPLVERFFASLKLIDKTSAENQISTKTEETANASKPTQTTKSNQPEANKTGSGSGMGSGSGYGSGSGRGNTDKSTSEIKPSTSPTPNNQTTGIKILSKPKALYTDFARFYDISGKVVLRVTFSANGTIGAISTVTKLPFGLTAQAIAAVKRITFEPAMKDGVPYSVAKPVEYNFTIY